MEFALNRQLKSLSSKLVWSIAAIGMTALAASSAATPRVLATSTKTNHPVCALVASPNGRDKNSGSRRSPLATVSKLVATLRPGQTGCLLSGRFEEDVKIIRKGTRARPFTLRSAPHAKATICGAVEVASPAEYWRLARLNFDGSCSTANTVMIFGDHITVAHSDITNRRDSQSCVYIGNAVYGRAHAVVLHYNRIHGCGKGDSRYFHGIYADAPRNARITDNYIYENAGFGIHLYPDARGPSSNGTWSTTASRKVVLSLVAMTRTPHPTIWLCTTSSAVMGRTGSPRRGERRSERRILLSLTVSGGTLEVRSIPSVSDTCPNAASTRTPSLWQGTLGITAFDREVAAQ